MCRRSRSCAQPRLERLDVLAPLLRHARRLRRCAADVALGGVAHRAHDVVVAGAAAEVALEPVADLLLARVRVALQEVGGRHDHARRAVAALERVVFPERLLERVQGSVGARHALDRLDLAAVGLDGEDGAALHGLAVEVDRARAAVRRVAAHMGAGEAETVANQVNEQQTRLDVELVPLPVDGEGNVDGAHSSPLKSRTPVDWRSTLSRIDCSCKDPRTDAVMASRRLKGAGSRDDHGWEMPTASHAAPAAPAREVLVARQPVLDAEMSLLGFELLVDGAAVVADALSEIGLEQLTGGHA